MYKDPRGPIRKIVSVHESPTGGLTEVSLSCGHVAKLNQIYHYTVGNDCRCFQCGQENK